MTNDTEVSMKEEPKKEKIDAATISGAILGKSAAPTTMVANEQSEEWTAKLVDGQITLAEYVGLSKKELYVIAQFGYQLLSSGKLQEAYDIYQGLVSADPFDSVFHCHLGATLMRMNKFDEAFNEFDAAIQFNIHNIDALAARGEIHLMRGNLTEAVEDLKLAIELDPEAKRPSTIRARAALYQLKEALGAEQEQTSAETSTE